ncbi:hypothetical protein [Pseudomonas fulva]|uniref:hypothetical protein n=1 Tax=Pseudomonas fulva TaxID=47880 RepID=UPI0018AA8951|nr:hypothetical protein [Pseudomonas fulva]MBF8774833.1 hypothetical protein [Pseudomonas fulva]
MKRTVVALLSLTSMLVLSGCWESADEKKAREQQEASENFWNITPPDESKDKGYKP